MADLPRPTWAEFLALFGKRWEQGEHVFINGQTGSGKTELTLQIMDIRVNRGGHVVFFVTKPRDPIFSSPFSKGYKKVTKFDPRPGDRKLMLTAKRGDSTADVIGNQQEVFADALDKTFKNGGWTLGVDETLWIANRLKLGNKVGDASFMGRALGITVVAATQRPAHVPVIVPQSASHAFIGKTSRKGDLDTLAELGGDTRETKLAIASLRDQHDFLYVDTQGKLPMMIVNTRA